MKNAKAAIFKKAMVRMKDEGHIIDVIYVDFANAFNPSTTGFF